MRRAPVLLLGIAIAATASGCLGSEPGSAEANLWSDRLRLTEAEARSLAPAGDVAWAAEDPLADFVEAYREETERRHGEAEALWAKRGNASPFLLGPGLNRSRQMMDAGFRTTALPFLILSRSVDETGLTASSYASPQALQEDLARFTPDTASTWDAIARARGNATRDTVPLLIVAEHHVHAADTGAEAFEARGNATARIDFDEAGEAAWAPVQEALLAAMSAREHVRAARAAVQLAEGESGASATDLPAEDDVKDLLARAEDTLGNPEEEIPADAAGQVRAAALASVNLSRKALDAGWTEYAWVHAYHALALARAEEALISGALPGKPDPEALRALARDDPRLAIELQDVMQRLHVAKEGNAAQAVVAAELYRHLKEEGMP